MKEIWKPILNLEHQYHISNKGRVLSLGNSDTRKDKILKGGITDQGYHFVVLFKKYYYRHRLVAEAFIENPFKFPEVHHLDNDKSNNNVTNLIWMTHEAIINRCHDQDFVDKKYCKKPVVQYYKNSTIKIYESIHEAGRVTGIDYKLISKVCNRYNRTAGGFEWKFV